MYGVLTRDLSMSSLLAMCLKFAGSFLIRRESMCWLYSMLDKVPVLFKEVLRLLQNKIKTGGILLVYYYLFFWWQ